MINNDQSTLLLYCCEDVKSYRSGGDNVPLRKKYCLFANTTLLFLLCFAPIMLNVSWELHVMSYRALIGLTVFHSKNILNYLVYFQIIAIVKLKFINI